MRHGAAAAGSVCMLLAATASSASAYPSRVEDHYKVTTTGGTCNVTVVAAVEPGVAVAIGSLRGTESVSCATTFTPYYIDLDIGFSGTGIDPLGVLFPDEPGVRCDWQKACYSARSEMSFPPGDHYVTHDVDVDVAPYAVADTFLSYPQGCRVASNDRGRLICSFRQWVTMPAPSP